jgi:hypothetical protein
MMFTGSLVFLQYLAREYLKGQVQAMQDMFITSKKPMMLEQQTDAIKQAACVMFYDTPP